MDHSLQINLIASGSITPANSHRFVHLTQPHETGMDKTASMFDISQMIARARSGQSAFTYKKNNCPAGVTDTGVNIRLDFEAWPSSPDLPHTISANIGEVSPPTLIDEYTEFSLVFEMSDVVELKFILSEITNYHWETDCYDKTWKPLTTPPEITMDGLTTVRCDQPIFGVVRIRGKKIGARHRLTTKLLKSYPVRPDEPLPEEGISAEDLEKYWAYTDVATWNGNPVDENETIDMTGLSLDNLSITVTAVWLNSEGKEESFSMQLEIPQCIKDLLAVCDGNLENFGGGAFTTGTTICDLADNPEQLTVYQSGCTGKVIDERKTKDDPDSWCEQ